MQAAGIIKGPAGQEATVARLNFPHTETMLGVLLELIVLGGESEGVLRGPLPRRGANGRRWAPSGPAYS